MKDQWTVETLKRGLDRMARKMENCFEDLNALDSQIGDGDIGITMVTGFRAMQEVSAKLPEDVGMALSKCAQAFVATRGSSFGTLMATGMLAAAKEVKGKKEVAWSRIPELLEQSIEMMARRGKSELGDKTVLDGLEAVRKALASTDSEQMLEAADQATSQALEEYKQHPCKRGKAGVFRDKSIGIDDPGMVVLRRLIEGLKET